MFPVVQGKKIPMTSGKDLVRLFKRLKKREKTQGTVSKVKPVAIAEPEPVAKAVDATVEIAPVPRLPINAVFGGDIANGATSPQMMPPPKFPMPLSQCNSTISKKLCEITQFPEFAMKSHFTVRFRQRDDKVYQSDLLVQTGEYKTVSEAHNAILQLVENKDAMLNDLDSFEIDDNLNLLNDKPVILMSFPDAIKLLHRRGVCTIDKDDILPLVEVEVAVASDAVQGVIVAQDSMAAVSDAVQGVIMAQDVVAPGVQGVVMTQVKVPAASDAARPITVKIRMRKVQASAFKTTSGFQNLKDSCLQGR